MTEAERIAAGLSEAQKRAVLALPTDCQFQASKSGFGWPTISVLKARHILFGHSYGKNGFVSFTQRGLETRKVLERSNDTD
jgi:hypothetical protein